MVRNRYDLMKVSSMKDSINDEPYPDVLSLNYNNFVQTQTAFKNNIKTTDVKKYWMFHIRYYQGLDYQDITLTLNNIPYRGYLGVDTVDDNDVSLINYIYVFEKNDLDTFYSTTQKAFLQ